MDTYSEKIESAKSVTARCAGKQGFWAGVNRYTFQCWTRDFVVSLPTLLRLGYVDLSRRHIETIFSKQIPSGEIPVLFADGYIKLFARKAFDAIKKGRMSFVFKKMMWPGLSKLSPGTRDVDAMSVLGAKLFEEYMGESSLSSAYEKQMDNAVAYIERELLNSDGLLLGADWRDMLEEQLKDKALLSNNAILYQMYKKLGRIDDANRIKQLINNLYWNGLYYRDHPTTEAFDPYGQALAVLFDIVPRERYELVSQKFEDVSMKFGFRIGDIYPKPTSEEEVRSVQKIVANEDTLGVVWPYINAHAILALLKIGNNTLAQEQWESWNELPGFYEWYDPESGKGYGDSEQLWTAALYLQVADKFS